MRKVKVRKSYNNSQKPHRNFAHTTTTPRKRHFVFGPELQLGLTMKLARIQQTPKQRYRYVPDLCR
ncbi:MAG: hypothetical protein HDT04_03455, partial [Bacteroidales bacterium]|nr:hypothetical protein [Bacteroidales bacterium]